MIEICLMHHSQCERWESTENWGFAIYEAVLLNQTYRFYVPNCFFETHRMHWGADLAYKYGTQGKGQRGKKLVLACGVEDDE